jgi:hypothetical protein
MSGTGVSGGRTEIEMAGYSATYSGGYRQFAAITIITNKNLIA